MSYQLYLRNVNLFDEFSDVEPVYALGGTCRRLLSISNDLSVGKQVVSTDGYKFSVIADMSEKKRFDLPFCCWMNDVYAYDFGDALVVRFPFSRVSGHEVPFDTSGKFSWFSLTDIICAGNGATTGGPLPHHRQCFMVATSLFLSLISHGSFFAGNMPEMCSVFDDEWFTPWLSDMLYRVCGQNLCTEISALCDGQRIVDLLNAGYALLLTFDAFYKVPFLKDYPENAAAHMGCVIPVAKDTFVYVDNGYTQPLKPSDILSLTSYEPDKRLVDRRCYHGYMLAGARKVVI